MRLVRFRLLTTTLLVAQLVACSDAESVQGTRPTVFLEHTRSVGELEGPLAFSVINGLAVHPGGILAVIDWHECAIALLDVETLTLIRRVGRCGDGPGEFRMIQAVTFVGDSLFVADTQHL